MNTTSDGKSLRRNVLSAFHQDGLAEIIFGAWFLSLGISIVLDATTGIHNFYVLSLGPLAGLTLLYPSLKTRITVPRIGYVRLPERTTRRMAWIWILLGCVALAALTLLGFFRSAAHPDFDHAFIFTLPLAISTTAFAFGGIRLQNPRWIAYSAIMAIGWVIGLLTVDPGWTLHATGFLLAGLPPVLGGLVVLTFFLRRHPKTAFVES